MRRLISMLAMAGLVAGMPGAAQVRTIDPNQPVDSDLNRAPPSSQSAPAYPSDQPVYADPPASTPQPYGQAGQPQPYQASPPAANDARAQAQAAAAEGDTFNREEVLSAAEGVFGKGAAGLAGIIERTLKEQGRPNAYIAGREAGGAIAIGLRYGGGTLFHKVEGQMPVHWTGPSVGFDIGGDASKVFVLVYNLYDTEDLFKRFPAGEGRLYMIGGFAATYLRRGNIVLIPIRLGVGWRQGVNIGYMKFSHKGKILPF